MRVVIALLKHETNTFSPVPTPLSRFGNGGPAWGGDAFRAYQQHTRAFLPLPRMR